MSTMTTAKQEKPPELLPCPFCAWRENHRTGNDPRVGFYVQCDRCLARVYSYSQDAANGLWNLRESSLFPTTTRADLAPAGDGERVAELRRLYDQIFQIKSTGDPKHPVQGVVNYEAKAAFEELLRAKPKGTKA